MTDSTTRRLGGTEWSWAQAVPGGTGITVVAILLSKPPNLPHLQNALHKLQNHHPILRSKFISTPPSYSILPSPFLQIQTVDIPTTSSLLQTPQSSDPFPISPLHRLLEHELNINPWAHDINGPIESDLVFATLYALPDSNLVFALRLHTSICDRTTAVALMKELLVLMKEGEGGAEREFEKSGEDEVGLPVEELIPKGKADKPIWTRGLDLVGYSLNSLRLAHLGFEDVASSRRSEVVRLQMDENETSRFLAECKDRGIKLCGALAAAGLIAANSSKHLTDNESENYAVVSLIDCRKILDPPLHDHNLGFYHSAILNTHKITNGEDVWDVAKRCYTVFSNAKNSNKHFTDMGDLNFLMCRAIENPGLTPSSSLRTSFMAVFEDPVIDDSGGSQVEVGLEDYMGCASVHGIGPSIAVFDTVRDGRLDCAFVYPSPLHSRKQMDGLINDMKAILMGGGR
ncbi:uncharacterized protein LOC131234696 [Magnolia sinica]|uniref:uncharacterized protein LOC131234696 n=1 Tax=Magnolia sinica TaxID=86752 RepID=UPI002658A4F2|nr:uncharacterized protein LOC131234696 [Magnolia sinica]